MFDELEVEATEYSSDCKKAVVICPECNKRHIHDAISWQVNGDGTFSKRMWYGFTCQCKRDITFMLSFNTSCEDDD